MRQQPLTITAPRGCGSSQHRTHDGCCLRIGRAERVDVVPFAAHNVNQHRYRIQGKCEYSIYYGADQRRDPPLTYTQPNNLTVSRRATEVDVAVHAPNRMLELGRPICVRIA